MSDDVTLFSLRISVNSLIFSVLCPPTSLVLFHTLCPVNGRTFNPLPRNCRGSSHFCPTQAAGTSPPVIVVEDKEEVEVVTGFGGLADDETAPSNGPTASDASDARSDARSDSADRLAPKPPLGATSSGRRKAGPAPAAPTDVAPCPDLTDEAKAEILSKLAGPEQQRAQNSIRLDGGENIPVAKRKKSKTIKKEAGKLLVRLKQMTDGCDSPADLPPCVPPTPSSHPRCAPSKCVVMLFLFSLA